MRTFVLRRNKDVSGVSGVGTVAEGIEFSDGVVALRWLVPAGNPGSGNPTSVVFHDRGVESVEKIHGHSGATQIVWSGAADIPDRNTLARQLADLRDQMDALREEYAATQERHVAIVAAFELDAGKIVDEVSDRAYDDKDMVVQNLKDRVYSEGYLEGLRSAERQMYELVKQERESQP